MVSCAVDGCKVTSSKAKQKNIRFYRFPKDAELLKLWTKACGNKIRLINPINARMCSTHFTDEDYTLMDQLLDVSNKRLKRDVVPTLNLPTVQKKQSARDKRAEVQARKELVQSAIEEYEKNISAERTTEPAQRNRKQKEEPMDTQGFETVFISETVNPEPEQQPVLPPVLHPDTKNGHFLLLKIVPKNEQARPKVVPAAQPDIDIEVSRELRIIALEKELKKAKQDVKKLQTRMAKADTLYSSLKRTLTEGQIRKLENPEKRIVWSTVDLSSAYCLYSAGPKAYRQLAKKNFPLPDVNTLRRWAAKNNFGAGMLQPVLSNMESSPYDNIERLCVLCFDEVRFSVSNEGDENSKQAKYAQIIMARGLLDQWSYPIYYEYDKRITLAILSEAIQKLEDIQFTVVAIVADMRITHQNLWKELGIDSVDPWLPNPARSGDKIFIFADALHLVRALRSHFVDNGFKIQDRIICVAPLCELQKPEILQSMGITYRSSNNETAYVKNTRRQDIAYILKCFSTSLVSTIRDLIQESNISDPSIIDCCEFIQTIAEWLGVFTSKISNSEKDERKMAFGNAMCTQLRILENMDNLMVDIRTNNKSMLKKGYEYPFQKGVRKCNAALPQFFEYMKETYAIKAIGTANLSQDVLDTFMHSTLQAKGNRYDSITPDEFKYSLESYIVGGM